MIHRQDTGDTHTHKHQRFGSGVYFKIRPIQLVQQIENLYKLQVYFDLVFNSMHCNIQFLPIPPGFTKCLHRCLGTESPLAAVPPNMLVRDPGVVIIIMGLLIPPPLSCSGVTYPPILLSSSWWCKSSAQATPLITPRARGEELQCRLQRTPSCGQWWGDGYSDNVFAVVVSILGRD